MPVLNKLFTLYIAALLLFPCSDVPQCADEHAPLTHEESTGEDDICTPFCICQCCRTAVEEFDWFSWITPDSKPIDSWNVFVVQSTKASPHNIWQPPRIG